MPERLNVSFFSDYKRWFYDKFVQWLLEAMIKRSARLAKCIVNLILQISRIATVLTIPSSLVFYKEKI